jgi:signal transduction histidine kinase
MPELDRDHLHREMIGAFIHDLRTPLTSLRMVVEVGRQMGNNDGGVALDNELVGMLESSLGDIQRLTDQLHELSWLERGRLTPVRARCSFRSLLERASAELDGSVELDWECPDGIEGDWDAERTVEALKGLVEASFRCGSGEGSVHLVAARDDGVVQVRIWSGEPGGEERPANADLGYPFFRSHALFRCLGGTVQVERADGYCAIDVELPLAA